MPSHPSIVRSLAVLLVSLIGVACGESTAEPQVVSVTNVTVTATPNPAEVTVTVQATAQVQPSDAPQSVTWSSSDEALATVNGSGLVTLLRRGTVTITATSTADSQHSGSVELTIVCPDPRLVSSNLSEDTTWENWVPDPECFDYVVQTDLSINAQLLTIEPGTVVGFEEGHGLRVRIDAGLNAEGTADEPIRLTGTEAERGHWWGIAIENTRHTENVLSHTTVEYAGRTGITINGVQQANVRLVDDALVHIDNSTFRQGAAYGVSIDFDVDVTGGEGNALTGNALGPAWLWGTEVPHLNGAALTGNDLDEVVVRPIAIADDALWPAATYRIIYYTQQAFTVTDGLLTLSPGVEMRFEAEQSMLVTGEAGLSAVGTADAPIRIRGTEPTPGHWGGVGLLSTNHAMNRLDHVVIEHGGGLIIGSSISEPANLVLSHSGEPTTVSVTNTTLSHGSGYGLFVRRDTGLEGFENNTMTGNAAGPAYVEAPVVDDLLTSNTFTGNGRDEIAVRTGTGMDIVQNALWRDVGIPFRLTSSGSLVTVVRDGAGLEISPGVEILVGPGIGISTQSGGNFKAVGTSSNRISISGVQGAWQGLDFMDATGEFDYVDISDGGTVAWGATDVPGAIAIRASGSAGGSTVFFRSEVNVSGSPYALVFSYGPTIGVGCPSPVYIPPPDLVSDHCRPPS